MDKKGKMWYDIAFCADRKCLRKVCPRHLSQLDDAPIDLQIKIKSFMDCEDRIHMEGDEDEPSTNRGDDQ